MINLKSATVELGIASQSVTWNYTGRFLQFAECKCAVHLPSDTHVQLSKKYIEVYRNNYTITRLFLLFLAQYSFPVTQTSEV